VETFSLYSLLLLLLALPITSFGSSTKIDAEDPHLRYVGRIGFDDPKAPSFHYAASSVQARFRGSFLALRFEEDGYGDGNWIGVRIDGGDEIRLFLPPKSDSTHVVAAGLADKLHDVLIYRRSDPMVGWCKFKGLVIADGRTLAELPPRPTRRIEFYGDSVMSGSATEAVGFEAQQDEAVNYDRSHENLTNGYWSFGAITARKLKAEAHVNGLGGLSLLDGTGWWCNPETIGMETTFDKLNPIKGQLTPWDFNRFIPHVVVISIGQNDANGTDLHNAERRARWLETYASILRRLRRHYPSAKFVLTTTVLMHDPQWDDILEVVASSFNNEAGTKVVRTCRFKRAGKGTPGHPRMAEQQEMADELAAFIAKISDVWKDPAK
jgi:hypothetical protein